MKFFPKFTHRSEVVLERLRESIVFCLRIMGITFLDDAKTGLTTIFIFMNNNHHYMIVEVLLSRQICAYENYKCKSVKALKYKFKLGIIETTP